MRSFNIAVLAVLGLIGSYALRGEPEAYVRSAYEDAIQRYQGGEAVQRAVAPRHAQPLADGSNASGVDVNYRVAEGAEASGVDNGRLV